MQFCSSLVTLKNDWILRSWSWHLQGCTLLHRLAKWFVWHIHHSLHLYLPANLNALAMNLTRCPESNQSFFMIFVQFGAWKRSYVKSRFMPYAFWKIRGHISIPSGSASYTCLLPRFRLRWVWGGIRLSRMSRWALQRNVLNRIRFSTTAKHQFVETDSLWTICPCEFKHLYFILLSFFPFASKFLCSSLSVGSVDTGQDYGAMDPAWLRSLGL